MRLQENGRKALSAGAADDVGRDAYLAAMHAAQAFLFELTGRVVKTHNGVQSEFARLTRDDPRFDGAARGLLSRTYKLKEIADYDTGGEVPPERAAAALDEAAVFVERITAYIGP